MKEGAGQSIYPDIITDLRALDPSRMAMERQREAKREVKDRDWQEKHPAESRPKKSASDLLMESRDARLRAKGLERRETPQERIKRIMAAQLNKQVKKDTLITARKKIEAERDRQARLQIERVAFSRDRPGATPPRSPSRSVSPHRHRRSYSRSVSPPRTRHNNRSRSRSRSREHRSRGQRRHGSSKDPFT